MSVRFTVLASGSAGNASLLETGGFGLLIDAGLGPRQLTARLAAVGASWRRVQAVLLTHTHGDHWKERTLSHLRSLHLPLFCHAEHQPALQEYSKAFLKLQKDGLARTYEAGCDLALAPDLCCRPLPLRHDGGATFGFRFDGAADARGQPWSMAYLADLGSWGSQLARALADVDLLALEFNHDVEMEYGSGRSARLIDRVLGEDGHLSNDQAAALLQEVVRLSAGGRPRQVVQLHLSRDCNRPELAAEFARVVLAALGSQAEVHTARQDRPGPSLVVNGRPAGTPPTRAQTRPASAARQSTVFYQPCLPGFQD